MNAFAAGLILVVVAGALEGLFSLPVTRTPRWRWENIWGLGSLVALVVVPWPLVFFTVHDLSAVYSQVSPGLMLLVFLFGAGWGLGGIFWGKAIAAVGMALGISLLMGFITVFGSLGPLAIQQPQTLKTSGGLTLIGAVAIMVVGVIIISLAGKCKEKELAGAGARPDETKPATSFMTGLLFCVVSGLMSALVNFGFIYGDSIAKAAAQTGTPSWAQAFAIWAIVFTGNYLVNFIYAGFLMVKNKTVKIIFTKGTGHYWLLALFLGIAWPAGIAIYGIAAYQMGPYGAYAGFPMMLLCSILFGNLAGALTGEWKGTAARSRGLMIMGIIVLFIAFAVLGLANKLLAGG